MYKLINGWTKQELMKKIELEFKGKSLAHETARTCLYRGPEGKKCAVGLFIPDDLYNSAFENRSYFALTNKNPELLKFMPLNAESMDALQFVHDTSKIETTKEEILKWIDTNIFDGAVNEI